MTVVATALLMEEVGDEIRQYLSLRAWNVSVDADLNVTLEETGATPRNAYRAYQHTPPLRTLTFRVERLEDIRAKLEEHNCLTRCHGKGKSRCGQIVRVTDEECNGFDQSYLCDCGMRWGA